MQQNKQHGFTLIELLIVVAIVGILAGIGIPAYQDSMVKSRRADAKAALLELSVFMERLYTATGCYNPGNDKDCTPPNADAATPTLPFDLAPKKDYTATGACNTDSKGNYCLTVEVTASTFTLTATPTKKSPDPKCGNLTLSNTGDKGASYAATAADKSACW